MAKQAASYLSSVTAHPAPPEGFSPLKASDDELAKFGFPQRPDARLAPQALADWENLFSRPMRRAQVELRELPGVRHGPNIELRTGKAAPKGGMPVGGTSSNWSGAVVFTGAAPIMLASGWWTVPDVFPRVNIIENCSSQWVGIDGIGSNDVLQTGTECDTTFFGGKNFYAWFEWFPANAVGIFGFRVSPGDRIFGQVFSQLSTLGSVFLANPAWGEFVSFALNAPPGTTLQGNCAEWIMERPNINGNITMLPHYGAVYFDSCLAFAPRQVIDLSSALLLTMVDGATTLSVPTEETARLVKTEG